MDREVLEQRKDALEKAIDELSNQLSQYKHTCVQIEQQLLLLRGALALCEEFLDEADDSLTEAHMTS